MNEDMGGLGALGAEALDAELDGPVTAEGLVKHGNGALAIDDNGDVYYVAGGPTDVAWYDNDDVPRVWSPDYFDRSGRPLYVNTLREALAVLAPWIGTAPANSALRSDLATRLNLTSDSTDAEVLEEVQSLKDGLEALQQSYDDVTTRARTLRDDLRRALALNAGTTDEQIVAAVRAEGYARVEAQRLAALRLDDLRATEGRLRDTQAALEDAENQESRVDEVLDTIGVPMYPTRAERLAYLAGRGLAVRP